MIWTAVHAKTKQKKHVLDGVLLRPHLSLQIMDAYTKNANESWIDGNDGWTTGTKIKHVLLRHIPETSQQNSLFPHFWNIPATH